MVTLPSSTITGTRRLPFVSFSILSSCGLSSRTLWYSTSYFLSAKASRADVV
jgi:hypothetical protein